MNGFPMGGSGLKAVRAAFFLLLAANLLLFAYGRGFFGQTGGGEPERLANQLQPEKLRIVAASAPATVPPAAEAAPPAVEAAPAAAESAPEACRVLSGLTQEQAGKLVGLLRGRDAQLRIEQRAVTVPSSWWIHLPPEPDRQQALLRVAELKNLGVTEYHIMEDGGGPNRQVVSLGLYKSEQSANVRLEALKKKGVHTASIEVRKAERAVVEVRAPGEALGRAMADLPAEFAALAAAECAVAKP